MKCTTANMCTTANAITVLNVEFSVDKLMVLNRGASCQGITALLK